MCVCVSRSDGRYHQQGEQSDTRSEAEIQRLFQQLHTSTPPPSEDTRPQSAASSSSLSLSSSSSSSSFTTPAVTSGAKASGRHLLETPAEGRSSSSDETLTGRKPPSPAAEVSGQHSHVDVYEVHYDSIRNPLKLAAQLVGQTSHLRQQAAPLMLMTYTNI